LDYGLEFVFLLAGDAHLAVLELALDLNIQAFNCLNDLLRSLSLEALFNMKFLSGVAQRRDRRILSFDISEIDAAFG